jgi:hypothetical protein
MSQFDFLKAEWPAVHDGATRAAACARADLRAACFYARHPLELAIAWAFKPEADSGPAAAPLGERLFKTRLELVGLDRAAAHLHPSGIDGVFGEIEADELLAVLESVRKRAVA